MPAETLQSEPATFARRTVARLALSACGAWVLFYALVVLPLHALIPTPVPSEAIRRELMVPETWLRPEPAERLMFLVSLVFFPVVGYLLERGLRKHSAGWADVDWWRAEVAALVAVHLVWWASGNELEDATRNLVGLVAIPAVIVFAAMVFRSRGVRLENRWWLGIVALAFFLGSWLYGASLGAFFIGSLASVLLWWLGIPATALVFVAWRKSLTIIVALIALATFAGLSFCLMMPEDSVLFWRMHFQANYSSVANVMAGGTLLVDTLSLYGTYPHLIAPLLRLFGGDAPWLTYAALMNALAVVMKLGWLVVLLRSMRHRSTAWLTWLSAIVVTDAFLLFSTNIESARDIDPYFQLHPIRTLTTTLAMVLGTWVIEAPSGRRMPIAAALSSLTVVWWNPEFGVVGWGALLAANIFLSSTWRRVAVVTATHVVALIGAFSSFTLFAWVRSGQLPRFSLLTEGVGTFYGAGFGMAPMTPIHPWIIVATPYVIGTALVLRGLLERSSQETVRTLAVVTLLSIIGAGEFTYFQGRSYSGNLMGVAAPAFMLVGLALDWLISNRPRSSSVVAIGLGLSLLASSGAVALPTLLTVPLHAEPMATWRADVEFYKAHTTPGERRLVLSTGAALFHSAAGTRDVGRAGMAETFTRTAGAQIEDFIQQPGARPVIVDLRPDFDYDLLFIAKPLKKTLRECFVVTETSPSGNLLVLQRRDPNVTCHSFAE